MESRKKKHSKSVLRALQSKSKKKIKKNRISRYKKNPSKQNESLIKQENNKPNKTNMTIIHDLSDTNEDTLVNKNQIHNDINDDNNKILNDNKDKIKEITSKINDITETLNNNVIYCRETEKEFILSFMTSKNKTLLLSGQPGTGKTSLVLDLFNSSFLKQSFIKLTMNCMSLVSIQEFNNQLFQLLNNFLTTDYFKKIYSKFFFKLNSFLRKPPSNQSLINLLSLLTSHVIIILLDEIDVFYHKNNELNFFDIINLPYLIDSEMKMILISNNSDFDNEILPKLLNRKIKIEKIVFKPYTPIIITKIIQNKLQDVGMADYFSSDSIRFLSSKMNKSGDIRPIIEITKGLILKYKSDFISQNKKIELKDMFEILKLKNIDLSEIITGMTTEQKLVVVAIYYALKKGESLIEEKEIYFQYKMIKTQSKCQQLSMEEFREILKTFCENGLIEIKKWKGKSNRKGNNIYRIKYCDDELEVIFTDSNMFKWFQKNDEESKDENNSDEESKDENNSDEDQNDNIK